MQPTSTDDRPSLAQRMYQSVYIYDTGQGMVKVGCSVKPGNRRAWIKKTYGLEYAEVEWVAPAHPFAEMIERHSHKLLKQYRIKGTELFQCSVRVAKAAVLQATRAADEYSKAYPEPTARRIASIEAGARQYEEWKWAERQKRLTAARTARAAANEARLAEQRAKEAEQAAIAEREAQARRAVQEAELSASLEASYRVRRHMLAADALIAQNPSAADEAIQIWKTIGAAWRGQEAT